MRRGAIVGRVISVTGDPQRIQIAGLKSIQLGSLVEMDHHHKAIVVQLGQKFVTALPINQMEQHKFGDQVFALGDQVTIKVSKKLLGRNKIIDPLGNSSETGRTVEIPVFNSTGLAALKFKSNVRQQLVTGIAGIDVFYPLGHGMRVGIMGDKKGKDIAATDLAIDIVTNLSFSEPDTVCVYAMIGKSEAEAERILQKLNDERNPSNENILVVSSKNTDPLALQYMAPFSACAIANYFRDVECSKVVVVIDNMHKHAQIASCSSETIREKFASINSAQSKIIDQFSQSNEQSGGGSSTCICVDFSVPDPSHSSSDGTEMILHKAASENLLSLLDDTIFIAKTKSLLKKSRKSFPILSKNTDDPTRLRINFSKVISRPGTRFQSNLKRWILRFVQDSLMPKRLDNYVTKDVLNVIGKVEYEQAVEQKEFSASVYHLLNSSNYANDIDLLFVVYCGIKALESFQDSSQHVKFQSIADISERLVQFIDSKSKTDEIVSLMIDRLLKQEENDEIPASEDLEILDSLAHEFANTL
jgi:hypothetical protein